MTNNLDLRIFNICSLQEMKASLLLLIVTELQKLQTSVSSTKKEKCYHDKSNPNKYALF